LNQTGLASLKQFGISNQMSLILTVPNQNLLAKVKVETSKVLAKAGF
jgi:hypothetical protein